MIETSKHRPLRVGFDLDGVLLYNPARVIRPIIAGFKKLVLHKKKTSFYYPKGRWKKELFRLFHKSSFMTASGLETLRLLSREGKIEAYLITARFDYLKPDLDVWLNKINAQEIFKACYHNVNDEQPHEFKAKMINKLNLEIFVEDNWDIVRHLSQTLNTSANPNRVKVLWITNLIDMLKIDYPFKFLSLKDALYEIIRQSTNRK